MRRALAIDEASFGPRPSQCRQRPQQPRAVAAGHEPAGGGRAADAPRAGHRREELRPDHPNVATDLNNLAAVAAGHQPAGGGRAVDAPRARHRREKLRRRASRTSPTALNNLAQLLQDTNRLGEAEPLMRRALAIDEKSFGPDHPNVAIAPQQPGAVAAGHQPAGGGRAADAPRAGDRREKLRAEHPNVAIGLNNLAQLLQDHEPARRRPSR